MYKCEPLRITMHRWNILRLFSALCGSLSVRRLSLNIVGCSYNRNGTGQKIYVCRSRSCVVFIACNKVATRHLQDVRL